MWVLHVLKKETLFLDLKMLGLLCLKISLAFVSKKSVPVFLVLKKLVPLLAVLKEPVLVFSVLKEAVPLAVLTALWGCWWRCG